MKSWIGNNNGEDDLFLIINHLDKMVREFHQTFILFLLFQNSLMFLQSNKLPYNSILHGNAFNGG